MKFFRWLVERTATAGLIIGLGLAACGLWLFLKDRVDWDEWRSDTLRALDGERAHTQSALADVQARMGKLSAEIAAEEERTRRLDKIVADLKALESTWDRLVGNPEQQRANAEQLAKNQKTRDESVAKTATLKDELRRTGWERDGLEIALGKLDGRLKTLEAKKSKVMHYLEAAWLRVRTWVIVALALYFLGPTLGKTLMFFGVAPLIVRGRPVRFDADMAALPEVSESRVATEVALRPGETLWVKEKFLQASDEGVRKKTRAVLDWKIPLTCAAAGLVELIEMRNEDETGEYRVTLSNQADPHTELAVVTLPIGARLVLRPSFLAGAMTGGKERLVIRRRWQIFRWQAWLTLQFRFFEFAGPCRLIVAGTRGVRAERLTERADNLSPARRTNQDATIGFTPNLDYRPVRAETFWSYYRGMNPLFDDLFAGRGLFLCQQVSQDGDAKQARRFWAGVWGGVMRLFGL